VDLAGLQEGEWFDWRAGLVVIGLLLVVLLLKAGIRVVSKVFSLWRSGQQKALRHRKSIRIEFYIRFEALLREFGWIRRDTQTQREFADEIERELEERRVDVEVHSLPARLVNAFYSMRFGELELGDDEIQSLYDDLSRLRQSLQPNPS